MKKMFIYTLITGSILSMSIMADKAHAEESINNNYNINTMVTPGLVKEMKQGDYSYKTLALNTSYYKAKTVLGKPAKETYNNKIGKAIFLDKYNNYIQLGTEGKFYRTLMPDSDITDIQFNLRNLNVNFNQYKKILGKYTQSNRKDNYIYRTYGQYLKVTLEKKIIHGC